MKHLLPGIRSILNRYEYGFEQGASRTLEDVSKIIDGVNVSDEAKIVAYENAEQTKAKLPKNGSLPEDEVWISSLAMGLAILIRKIERGTN